MHITRQTPTELVARDSAMWLAIPFALGALFLLVLTIMRHNPEGLLGVGLLLLFAIPPARYSTFTFDAMQRMVRWSGRKLFKAESGTIPFDDITDIGTEATSSGRGGATYRLTILTPQGSVPMAYTYSNGKNRHAQMRETILAFLHPERQSAAFSSTVATPGATLADESSIRSLLSQGRRIDAITLVRIKERVSLTEAVTRVNKIDDKMKEGR